MTLPTHPDMSPKPHDTADLEETARIVRERDEAIAWLQGELAELRRMRARDQAVSESLASQLDTIFNSKGWRMLMRYRRLKERWRRLLQGRAGARMPQSSVAVAVASNNGSSSTPVATQTPSASHVAAALDPFEALTLSPALVAEQVATVLDLPVPSTSTRKYDVICLSIIDWEFRFQRPQQVMSQFAANGHRVFYVSPSRFGADADRHASVRMIRDNVYEVQLAASGSVDVYGAIDGANEAAMLQSLADLRRDYDISTAMSYVMIASWSELASDARQRWGWPIVYDCMDEWDRFPGVKPAVVERERQLVAGCDLLVVTAQTLLDKWKQAGRPMVLARNGVDHDFYRARCRPNALLHGMTHPIVGYCGAIADWFDVALVTALARARPQYQFVLLGGVFDVDVSELAALPNVSLLGQQPYATMPQYIYHFDVCLIPFKINPITEATDPVKVYEYLSAGKPVVSAALPELEPYRDLVYLARSRSEFLTALDRAVCEDDGALVERRMTFAASHTWRHRYEAIDTALAGAVPLASIVIVTYNNLPLTRLCIESLLRNTSYPNYEILVVDNASTDGTPAYLRYMSARHSRLHAVLNATNVGFPRATNDGLARSRGEYLVLLNNDTIVPPGWLSRLLQHLRDPDVGLVGPVTNFVGNEAKIDAPYRTWAEMEQFAADRAARFDGQIADIHMLAMFCAAMRADTYRRVGPLDERFGIGMFEDDDYAHRIREQGRRVVCAADAFVHHVGQAAFKRLIERGEYDDLFATNRRLYEEKWRVAWRRHEHAPLAFAAHAR